MRLAAADMTTLEPFENGERGVVISTASIAAFEGQIGQAAYSSSKGGIVGLTMPAARELAQFGIRGLASAPGLFLTPLLMKLPEEIQSSLGAVDPLPQAPGPTARIRRAGAALHPEFVSERRSNPPGRRVADGSEIEGKVSMRTVLILLLVPALLPAQADPASQAFSAWVEEHRMADHKARSRSLFEASADWVAKWPDSQLAWRERRESLVTTGNRSAELWKQTGETLIRLNPPHTIASSIAYMTGNSGRSHPQRRGVVGHDGNLLDGRDHPAG